MKTDSYFNLWTKAFGLSPEELSTGDLSIVSSGYYVERHQDKYVFSYKDELLGKRVLAASERNLATVRETSWLENHSPAFRDIDFCLADKNSFLKVTGDFYIRPLFNHQEAELESFYQDCSEDDKDTLDLTFENETVLGLYQNNLLAGVARFVPIRNTSIADITVLVRNEMRGRGFSAPLVSRLVELILAEGLLPKYRVGETNLASIAVAKRLGFYPRFRVLAWDMEAC